MLKLTHLIGFAAGGIPRQVTYLGYAEDAANLTTYTFASKSLGIATSDRRIVVVAHARAVSSGTILSSVSVAGISATKLVGAQAAVTGNSNVTEIWMASVPTGTTGDIVVVGAAGLTHCSIGWYGVTGVVSSTPEGTATNTTSASTATMAISPSGSTQGGIVIGGVSDGGTGGPSLTWSGWSSPTETYDQGIETRRSGGCWGMPADANISTLSVTPSVSASLIGASVYLA